MQENRQTYIINKLLGSLSLIIGIMFLFSRSVRQYIPILEPYAFGIFMISPIFIILGVKMICKDVKIKVVHTFSNVLLGLAVIYLIILSASWYTINVISL